MQLTDDWLLVKVAKVLLIGLTKIFWTKSGFNLLSATESPLRVQRLYDMNGRFQMQGSKNWILPK
jgi:hypothetical protein